LFSRFGAFISTHFTIRIVKQLSRCADSIHGTVRDQLFVVFLNVTVQCKSLLIPSTSQNKVIKELGRVNVVDLLFFD
jgi:hypothetical protein